ncbi:hypothetical protein K2X05_00905 [bacterium]|nr:hypothetical protein [bacterium]
MFKMMNVAVVIASLFLQGCLSYDGYKTSETTNNPEQGPLSTFDANVYPLNKVVCDPFDPGTPGPNDGMIATLYYRGANQPRWYTVDEYIQLGQKSSKYLFFSKLDVPTRIFSMGFPSETGESIQNDQQQVLNEYFALSVSSVLKLAPQDAEGEYELALLSDDGAIMQIRDDDGVYRTVVNNDGDHPTKLGCGQRITMTRNTEFVVKLNYYQGPRYHISLIPMWRKVDASTTAEPRCGQLGNSLFFDFNNNSQPQPAYNELLSRGWKPIAAENWHMPAFALFNPCTQGTIPTISNYINIANSENFVSFQWSTNIPATAQMLYKNLRTGEEVLTTSDNRLRVVHYINLTGLTPRDTYEFRAISISADYGKSISAPITLQVQ